MSQSMSEFSGNQHTPNDDDHHHPSRGILSGNNNNNHSFAAAGTISASDGEILKDLGSRSFLDTFRPFEWALGIAFALSGFLIGSEVQPFCRPFMWNDATISNEHKPDTIPVYALVIMVAIGFIGTGIFVFFFPQLGVGVSSSAADGTPSPFKGALEMSFTNARRGEVTAVLLFALHTMMINELVTGTVKVFDGRLRPDFISRLNSLGYTSANSTVDYCELSKKESLIHDGRLSFPSGHSSTSFMCCTALSLYFLSRLRAWSTNTGSLSSPSSPSYIDKFRNGGLRFFLGALPMVLCIAIAVTRTRDNRHHHADILCGAIIGFLSANISWRLHFVSVDQARLQMLMTMNVASSSPSVGTNQQNASYNTTNNVVVIEGENRNQTQNLGDNLPWFLKEVNRNSVGDHIPRWLL
jgi:membrane-associated phospholipid phosphatase